MNEQNIDLDMITIKQSGRHVIASSVYNEKILFFSIENDCRLHYFFLDNSNTILTNLPRATSNIIQIVSYQNQVIVLSQTSIDMYFPDVQKCKNIQSTSGLPHDYSDQLFFKMIHMGMESFEFIVAISTSISVNCLYFFIVNENGTINTLKFMSIPYIIQDFELENIKITQEGFLDEFTLLLARSKESTLIYTAKITEKGGSQYETKAEINPMADHSLFINRADKEFICLSEDKFGKKIGVFLRYGISERADFVNALSCRAELPDYLAYFYADEDNIILVTQNNDYILIKRNVFEQEFVDTKTHSQRTEKKIDTFCEEIRHFSGYLLWAGKINNIFTLICSDDKK